LEKQKFHTANEKAQHALMGGSVFVFLFGQGGVEERFLGFFSLVLKRVPIIFPNGSSSSQVVPEDIPNNTSVIYDYSYP